MLLNKRLYFISCARVCNGSHRTLNSKKSEVPKKKGLKPRRLKNVIFEAGLGSVCSGAKKTPEVGVEPTISR